MTTSRHRIVFLLAATLAGLLAFATAPPSRAEAIVVQDRMQTAVTGYRQILVAMESEGAAKGPALAADPEIARLRAEREEALDAVREAAIAEIRSAAGTGGTTPQLLAVLDFVERDDLVGIDRLGFADLLADLLATIEELPPGERTALSAQEARLRLLGQRIETARSQYDGEVGSGDAKGMGTPRWDGDLEAIQEKLGAKGSHATPPPDARIDPDFLLEPGAKGLDPFGLGENEYVLTFDDGPHSSRTARILEILARHEAPAIFFQVGQNLGSANGTAISPGAGSRIAERVLAAGHRLANHSYSHPNLAGMAANRVRWQIDATNQLLAAVSGKPPVWFRPPYGSRGGSVRPEMEKLGLTMMLWQVDSRDWAEPRPAAITASVLDQARRSGRGIILFHDIHEQTVLALPGVIAGLQEMGGRLVLPGS